MIEVRYKARLGNNLFQYCFGRILAQELNYALQAEPIPGFPGTTDSIVGAKYESPEQLLTGQRIDLTAVLADRSPRRIVLDGWFQRYEYYRPFRDPIRKWLKFEQAAHVGEPQPGLVVNVRRTDYVQLGWALPFDYYREAIERLAPFSGPLWIVTDDARDPFMRQFDRWRPQYFVGSGLEQLAFMSRAARLVMSQSTFSWWPTFLGTPERVVCPVPEFGCWGPNGDGGEVDLIERDRFECLPCPTPYTPTAIEARYQRWRLFKRRAVLKFNRTFPWSLPVPPP